MHWIEYQFDVGISWDNYGDVWHLDHVMPCSKIDFSNQAEIETCFHWSNIRPLHKKENMHKSDKVCEATIQAHKIIVEQYKHSLLK